MTQQFSPDIQRANKTYRSKGIIGKSAIIPKLAAEIFPKSARILDFGAGPDMIHTLALREKGFDVDAFDFGGNWRDGMVFDVVAGRYDFIFASNVANVWNTEDMVNDSLRVISQGLKQNGFFLSNIPKKPRYFLDSDSYGAHLVRYFGEIRMLKKDVWYCKKGLAIG